MKAPSAMRRVAMGEPKSEIEGRSRGRFAYGEERFFLEGAKNSVCGRQHRQDVARKRGE